ncbi:TPA: hypothetical protein DIV55_00520 [Patescibacteria group bacterium]|uniref:Integral membrane protein n=1 Tax=Candidatus Gottesmanbacteria bacterium GW2011_GWA1_43_11 TaxID=1618436 RepID=A0A0G1EKP6_9BACT|nr:MAG: hypothetical protein UV59_C0036G0016 [Candidatus Gottesmanbacteria bacterium GW2011_GWA1_43_11]HCS78208.1 hypothetical protein [Patescibacteria group bacterium]
MHLIIKWFASALTLVIVSQLIPGFQLENFTTALVAALIISLVNAFLKPILTLLTLPITFLTLGLFSLVINAILLLLAAGLTPGFIVDGFGTALIASILITIISTLLHSLLK